MAIMLAILVSSCKKDYLDINDNPNTPTTSTGQLVLTNALNVTAGRIGHNQIGSFWGGYWSPPTTVSGFAPERTYNAQASFGTAVGLWQSCYDNLNDYDFVEKYGQENKIPILTGMAQVMKVFNFQLLVDAYGDVPYKQALKGLDNFTPAYDSAPAIYADLIPKLDVAISNLRQAVNPDFLITTQDIYFGGNTVSWVRFANTLKLRILLRQSKIAGKDQYIKDEIAKIFSTTDVINGTTLSVFLSGQFFLAKNENVASNPGYLRTTGRQNPFFEFYFVNAANASSPSRQFYVPSLYFTDKIYENSPDDLRDVRTIGGNANVAGGFTGTTLAITRPVVLAWSGVPFGETNNPLGGSFGYSDVANFGPGVFRSFNQNAVVMTASEALMLQAEAKELGFMPAAFAPTALALFQDAVRSSFVILYTTGASAIPAANAEAAANAYMALPGNTNALNGFIGNYATSPDKLRTIMEQKFICLFGFSGFETWCDVRKYQNVDGTPSTILDIPRSVNTGVIGSPSSRPLRLPYPVIEQQVNNTNLKAAIAAQQFGATIVSGKGIFWDVK